MRRRVLLLMALPAMARAQLDWRRVAVPHVTPQAWLQSLHARWYVPRSREFADAARALAQAQGRYCEGSGMLEDARSAWRRAMSAWERLSAVAIGPLVRRRSARRIDFTPARPSSIERAVAQNASDMALVGAPAKGLPALEWLLWTHRLARGSAACAHARRVADEIAAEATALAEAFASPPDWDDEAAVTAAYAEALNQFVAGIELLRWAQIERPLKEGRKQFPRAASHSTAAAWAARWDALRRLSVYQEGADAPISMEAYLRGRGLNPLADGLVATVKRSDVALRRASIAQAGTLAAASKALGDLKRRVEDGVAPALDVPIGFSDADGD
jgi:hypothetical protein